jgi:hypothetical protein
VRALALTLLVALPAAADDAPVVEAPRCLEPAERVALARTVVDLQATNLKLEADLKAAPSTALVVVLVVAGVVVGGVAGFMVTTAVRR